MSKTSGSRFAFYAWSLLACPVIGWLAAVLGTRGEGGPARFVLLFVGLPVLLALTGAVASRRRAL